MNVQEFNTITKDKYLNEPMEFFKCSNCGLVFLGLPDCHTAFYDPSNMKKTIGYNLPRNKNCPQCNSKWQVQDVIPEEIANSLWNWTDSL